MKILALVICLTALIPTVTYSQGAKETIDSKTFAAGEVAFKVPNTHGRELLVLARDTDELGEVYGADKSAKDRANLFCIKKSFKKAKPNYKTRSAPLDTKLWDLKSQHEIIVYDRCYLPSVLTLKAFLDPKNIGSGSIPNDDSLTQVFQVFTKKKNGCDKEVVAKALEVKAGKESDDFTPEDDKEFFRDEDKGDGKYPIGKISSANFFTEITCTNSSSFMTIH